MDVNIEISVDLKYLIGVVQDAFYSSEEFRKKVQEKQPRERTMDDIYWLRHLSDREDGDWNTVGKICQVMGLDRDRLISIARLTRKWEIKHDWQLCFPVDSHAQKILAFCFRKDGFCELNGVSTKIDT